MKKKKAIFTYDFGEANKKIIEDMGYDFLYPSEDLFQLSPEMMDAEVMVCYDPFSKIDCTKMPNLKWIQLVSKGINHVPENLRDRGLLITNNTQTTSIPIGEWIVTFILELFKDTRGFIRKQDKSQWEQNRDVMEVYGKTIGFLGTGRIAREAARRLKAFDATVIGVNEVDATQDYFDQIYGLDGLEELFGRCDAIVSTLPATDSTYHMINEKTIAQMKDGVCLINVSRGAVVDTDARVRANQHGKFRGIALDVYEQEPLPADHPLWKMENVIMTPHNVMWSDLYYVRCFDTVYKNFVKYCNNEPLNDIVDFVRGY